MTQITRQALIIGINHYQHFQDLSTPARDAQAVAALLHQYSHFNEINLLLGVRQDCVLPDCPVLPVKSGILQAERMKDAIGELLNPDSEQLPEVALLYFSGHGFRHNDRKVITGFLASGDTDYKVDAPQTAHVWGVELDWLHKQLALSPIAHKIVILDCCHAGQLLEFAKALHDTKQYCLLASCRDVKSAYVLRDAQYSVFTTALVAALDPRGKANGVVNTSTLRADIEPQLQASALQTALFFSPVATIEVTRDLSKSTQPPPPVPWSFDLTPYLNGLVKDFEHWQKVFVDIRGKFEDIMVVRPYGMPERQKYGDMEGTVSDIRRRVTERRMVVIGNAGMGKTTTLQHLAKVDAQYVLDHNQVLSLNHPLPVYVELRNFVSAEQTIFDKVVLAIQTGLGILDYEASRVAGLRSFVQGLLIEGKVTLFLDGLNEISKDMRERKSNEVMQFIADYPQVFYLLTSRKEQYRQVLVEIPAFDLQPMDLAQITLFLARNATQPTVEDLILKAVKANSYLAQFVNIPFNLLMLIRVVEEKGEVPSSYPELLEVFIGQLYGLQRQKEYGFDADAVNLLLAHLAHETKQKYEANPELYEGFILKVFKKVKQDYGFELNLLVTLQTVVSLNILRLEGGKYTFVHQLFLEYFADLYYGDDDEVEFED